jgi:hypothetical protein
MLGYVALVRTDVSEERITFIIRVTKIIFLHSVLRLLVTANVVPRSPILATHDGGDTFLRIVGHCKSHLASHPRRRHSSFSK